MSGPRFLACLENTSASEEDAHVDVSFHKPAGFLDLPWDCRKLIYSLTIMNSHLRVSMREYEPFPHASLMGLSDLAFVENSQVRLEAIFIGLLEQIVVVKSSKDQEEFKSWLSTLDFSKLNDIDPRIRTGLDAVRRLIFRERPAVHQTCSLAVPALKQYPYLQEIEMHMDYFCFNGSSQEWSPEQNCGDSQICQLFELEHLKTLILNDGFAHGGRHEAIAGWLRNGFEKRGQIVCVIIRKGIYH